MVWLVAELVWWVTRNHGDFDFCQIKIGQRIDFWKALLGRCYWGTQNLGLKRTKENCGLCHPLLFHRCKDGDSENSGHLLPSCWTVRGRPRFFANFLNFIAIKLLSTFVFLKLTNKLKQVQISLWQPKFSQTLGWKRLAHLGTARR